MISGHNCLNLLSKFTVISKTHEKYFHTKCSLKIKVNLLQKKKVYHMLEYFISYKYKNTYKNTNKLKIIPTSQANINKRI